MSILLHDSTLRDGNHAARHRISLAEIQMHCMVADNAGLYSVEVGHGNGLGASSFQVGFSAHSDHDILLTARQSLKKTKLAVHVMPGFSTFNRDILPAIQLGVDIFRIGTHVTESDLAYGFVEKIKSKSKAEVIISLMMAHMASHDQIIQQVTALSQYDIDGLSIYDSAGTFDQDDVFQIVSLLAKEFPDLKIGFHGHNNLGLAVANSLSAVEAGARIIDSAICGYGAGAGNTQLETLASVMKRKGLLSPSVDMASIYDLATFASSTYAAKKPFPSVLSIASATAGVFSGFASHVEKASAMYGISSIKLFEALGERGVVGGQEDIIYTTASEMQTEINCNISRKSTLKNIELSMVRKKTVKKNITSEQLNERSRFAYQVFAEPDISEDAQLNTVFALSRENIRSWGELYFDGERSMGYGGYSNSIEYWDLFAQELIDIYNLDNNSRILEIGPAKGFLMEALQRKIPGAVIFGVEVSNYAISKASSYVKNSIIHADASRLFFPSRFFDLCLAVDVLQEIDILELPSVLREMNRVSSRSYVAIPTPSDTSHESKEMFLKWALNARVIMSDSEWLALLSSNSFNGDYQFFGLDINVIG